ncbi:MAG: DUF1877 family protein, partial [Verrucomicrobiota bacterium]
MAGRGVHFAITDQDMVKLGEASDGNAIIAIVTEEIESRWEKEDGFVAETDKAWDAIHRCLTNGKLEYDAGEVPLKWCIIGGILICEEDHCIISLVEHHNLAELAHALEQITKPWFRERYFTISQDDYESSIGEEDFEYTWSWFSGL